MKAANLRLGVLIGAAISITAAISCVDDAATASGDGNDDGGGSADSSVTPDGSISTGDGSIGSDGGSNADGDGGPDAGPCPGETGCPALVGAGHLQLWLRGDKGMDCPVFRITTWHDQSTHGRDAIPVLNSDGGAALAPQCGVDKINNLTVPTFTDPIPSGGTASTASNDETLHVDLGFLKGHEFTVAIVHKQSTYLYSTGLLSFANPTHVSSCASGNPGPINAGAFWLGLTHDIYDGGNEQYGTSLECYGTYPSTSSMAPQLVVYTFDNATGHHLFINSVESALFTSVGDASAANLTGVTQDGGENSVIGRLPPIPAFPLNLRYKGNIAEIVAYDSALSAGDRFVVQTYLKTKWNLPF